MSSNATSSPVDASSYMPTSRTPGVSRIAPPPGTGTSARNVVVWRPRPSDRSSRVPMTAAPTTALTKLDLPAPDGPNRPSVRPGATYGRSASMPAPVRALTANTGTRGATRPTDDATAAAARDDSTSALVRMISGVAPQA